MLMREWTKVYRKNRLKISKSITQLNRSLNKSIRNNKHEEAYVHVRCLFLLWVSWLEVSMDLILHSANHITQKERYDIKKSRREIDRWRKCIEICFKMYYLKPRRRVLNKINLGPTAYYRYQELNSILEKYIVSYIEIRNRLAHGQWYIAINSDGTGKNQRLTTELVTLSKREILSMKSIIKNFVDLVFVLTLSKKDFSRKFDHHISRIDLAISEKEMRFESFMNFIKPEK